MVGGRNNGDDGLPDHVRRVRSRHLRNRVRYRNPHRRKNSKVGVQMTNPLNAAMSDCAGGKLKS